MDCSHILLLRIGISKKKKKTISTHYYIVLIYYYYLYFGFEINSSILDFQISNVCKFGTHVFNCWKCKINN